MGNNLPWFYGDRIVFKDDEDKFQFVHVFHYGTIRGKTIQNSAPVTETFPTVLPILDIIQPFSIAKIRAKLLPRTPEIAESSFHTDIGGMPEEKLKQWTTAIFYVNTNNGYTKFEDGTKVESVANRMLSFPANMKHCGSSCTDEKRRIVINLNYFENIPKE
jgi:hypothetical protein